MDKPVRVGLVGVTSWARTYVGLLLDRGAELGGELAAVVSRDPSRCERHADLRARGVREYATLAGMLDGEPDLELVIISSPLHLHAPQSVEALERGVHVLCEKPVAGVVQDGLRMAAAAQAAGRLLEVAYQWSFTDAVQALKRETQRGTFGRPLRFRSLINWPRAHSYYARSSWAAALRTPEGDWVLDSPVNNATAHHLHNSLYVLGATTQSSVEPLSVQAELYRANAVQNYDTAALRVRTAGDVEILFYTSHAVPSDIPPTLSYEYEDATVTYEFRPGNPFVARFRDGRRMELGSPEDGGMAKLRRTFEAIRGGGAGLCGVEASLAHTRVTNGAQESVDAIAPFPPARIRTTGPENPLTYVEGLQGVLVQCFVQGILPAEHGHVDWARAGRVVDLRGYDRFPRGEHFAGG